MNFQKHTFLKGTRLSAMGYEQGGKFHITILPATKALKRDEKLFV